MTNFCILFRGYLGERFGRGKDNYQGDCYWLHGNLRRSRIIGTL